MSMYRMLDVISYNFSIVVLHQRFALDDDIINYIHLFAHIYSSQTTVRKRIMQNLEADIGLKISRT